MRRAAIDYGISLITNIKCADMHCPYARAHSTYAYAHARRCAIMLASALEKVCAALSWGGGVVGCC